MSNFRTQFRAYAEEQLESLPPFNEGNGIKLDSHQIDAMTAMCLAMDEDRDAFSIIQSCGSGKTILEANMLIASQRAKRVLGLENKQDLIITTERALLEGIRQQLVFLGLDVGIWGNNRRETDRPTVLASIQSLQASTRREVSHTLPVDSIDLIIGDEADAYLTNHRRSVISRFKNALKIGLTATPTWPDGRDVSELWGEKIHSMPLREGILRGVNVPPLYYLFETEIDESDLGIEAGDYDRKTLGAALREAEIHRSISQIYESLIPIDQRKSFPTIVFVPSVGLVFDVVESLRERFQQQGLTVQGWTGKSISTSQMREDIIAFNCGKLDILVLCEMGGRGLDLPPARFLIDAYPTLSPTKLEQRHGRVLRRIRNDSLNRKSFSLIAQLVPSSNRYRPYLLPDLLDCWDDFRERRLLVYRPRTGVQGSFGGGAPGGDEVRRLRQHIEEQNPDSEFRMLRRIDVYEQLALRQQLPQADENGFFILEIEDGDQKKTERYGSKNAWSNQLELGSTTLDRRLHGQKGIRGKDSSGVIREHGYYAESVVKKVCADLLGNIPQANEEGFIYLTSGEGDNKREERYGSIRPWAKELKISGSFLTERLKEKTGITGKNRGGRVLENGFYSESIVRQACADLLQNIPQADEDGFILLEIDQFGEKKVERYATIGKWAKILGLTVRPVALRLKEKEGITAKDSIGHLQEKGFYSESVVREVCADHLQNIPQANKDGFFLLKIGDEQKKKEEKFGSINFWTKTLGISGPSVTERLKNQPGITAKDGGGGIRENGFYSESVVRQACADLLQNIPQADKDGFFIISIGEGDQKKEERYSLVSTWAKELGLNPQSITTRLVGKEGISGKNRSGHVFEKGFFPESTVREVCADLLQYIPQCDENGFFTFSSGEGNQKTDRYATITRWAEVLGISHPTITGKLKEVEGMTLRDQRGHIRHKGFYAESVVREVCADLLQNVPKANEDGFIIIPSVKDNLNERYGTLKRWAKELNITNATIKRRLNGKQGIKGRDGKGQVHETGFYSESVIREVCSDLIAKRKKTNESS